MNSDDIPPQNAFISTEDYNTIIYQEKDIETINIHMNTLRIAITEFLANYNKRSYWKVLLPLFVSLLVSLLTSDFKDFFYIDSCKWYGIFFIATIFSGGLLICSSIKAIWGSGGEIEDVIRSIKDKCSKHGG